jgi:hypothetical protein
MATGPTNIQIKRTSTADKVPTISDLTQVGELGLNMNDARLFFRDGSSNIKELGANVQNQVITDDLVIGGGTTANSTQINVDTLQVDTALYVGANVDVTTSYIFVGNSTVNAVVNSLAVRIQNSTVDLSLSKPTAAQAAGDYYYKADGTWSTVTASATPAGSNTEIQYNDSDATGANQDFTFDDTTTALSLGSTTNTVITPGQIKLANSTVNTYLTIPTSAQYSGDYYLHANGDWTEVSGGGGTVSAVYEAWTANSTVNNDFTVTGGYTVGQVHVFINGVKLAHDEFVATDGSSINLDTDALLDDIVEVEGYKNLGALSSSRIYEKWTANSTVNTTWTVTGGYTTGLIDIYVNGVKLANDEYTATNGTTFTLDVQAPDGATVDVAGWKSLGVINSTSSRVYQKWTANSTVNNDFTVTGGYTVGSVDVFYNGSHLAPTVDFTATDSTTLTLTSDAADGAVVEITGYKAVGLLESSQRVYQKWTANSTVNTEFQVTGGFTVGEIDVYYNGVKLAVDEYTQDSSNVVLDTAADDGTIVEVVGYKAVNTTAIVVGGDNTHIIFNDSGFSNGSAGFTFDKDTNNAVIANTLTIDKFSMGNSTVNVFSNSVLLKIENTTDIANLEADALTIGTSVVNSTAFAAGANVFINQSLLSIGNSTVNTLANSSLIKVENATDIANLAPATLTIGGSVINTTAYATGANVYVNTTRWFVGNSTVNAFSNSIQLQLEDATLSSVVNTSVISSGGSLLSANIQINQQTGTAYTLAASDSGKYVTMDNGSAMTVTVPAGLPIGFRCMVLRLGAGTCTLSNTGQTGCTIQSRTGSFAVSTQYGSASVFQTQTANTYIIDGDV